MGAVRCAEFHAREHHFFISFFLFLQKSNINDPRNWTNGREQRNGVRSVAWLFRYCATQCIESNMCTK